ncbi:MAG: hypothetical protein PHC33_04625 [Candidatus Omnitrophica bacterium]|nr:hypothetical protein [Candidatus Omnitrophota bacterium]
MVLKHRPVPDPSNFTGTYDEKLSRTKEVREQIEAKIKDWLKAA